MPPANPKNALREFHLALERVGRSNIPVIGSCQMVYFPELYIFSRAPYIFPSSIYFPEPDWNSHLVSIDNTKFKFSTARKRTRCRGFHLGCTVPGYLALCKFESAAHSILRNININLKYKMVRPTRERTVLVLSI
jgi:hypothetical protein